MKGADAQPAPPGEYSHYVKKTGTVGHAAFDYPSSMGMAIFFKDNKQAIHFGSPTDGSHACVHVDWDKQKTAMRLLNYHSMVGTTVVSVEYEKNAALKQVCCHPNRVKRGFVNPCDVYSEADCAGPPKKK